MKGTMMIIRANGDKQTVDVSDRAGSAMLDILQAAVGGDIEEVPGFAEINVRGVRHLCVVFCDEEGKLKGKPINILANMLWRQTLSSQGRLVNDTLCGDVAVVYGDAEFMREL